MQTASRYPWGKGTPRWIREAATQTAAGVDTTYTVPAGKLWKPLYVYGEMTAVGVANRFGYIIFSNAADTIYISPATTVIVNTQTGAVVVAPNFSGYVTTLPAASLAFGLVAGGKFTAYCPEALLLPGYTIRINFQGGLVADVGINVLHYIEYDE